MNLSNITSSVISLINNNKNTGRVAKLASIGLFILSIKDGVAEYIDIYSIYVLGYPIHQFILITLGLIGVGLIAFDCINNKRSPTDMYNEVISLVTGLTDYDTRESQRFVQDIANKLIHSTKINETDVLEFPSPDELLMKFRRNHTVFQVTAENSFIDESEEQNDVYNAALPIIPSKKPNLKMGTPSSDKIKNNNYSAFWYLISIIIAYIIIQIVLKFLM